MKATEEGHECVRWGVLGCSRHALSNAIPALQSTGNAKVVGLASRTGDLARHHATLLSIPKWFSCYDDLVSDVDIDAVYVPLPNHLHAEWSARAAEAGKHVLCEKPAALSRSQMGDVKGACDKTGVLFMEGLMYRFHPQHQYVRQLVSSGVIGDLRLVRASFSFPLEARHSSTKTMKASGGALADIGCYCIDLCSWMFECAPQHAWLYSPWPMKSDVDFTDIAVLEFTMERVGFFDVGFSYARRNHCELVGAIGTIDVTAAFGNNLASTVTLRMPLEPPKTLEFSPINTLRLQFEHFSNCILRSQAPAISILESIQNAATLEMLTRLLTMKQRNAFVTSQVTDRGNR